MTADSSDTTNPAGKQTPKQKQTRKPKPTPGSPESATSTRRAATRPADPASDLSRGRAQGRPLEPGKTQARAQGQARAETPAPGPAPSHEPPGRPTTALSPLAYLLHSASLVRATALDLAILAGHLLLYPTGVFPERVRAAAPRTPAIGAAPGGTLRLPTEGRSHPPVVMLHGFVDNRSVFTLLRRSLLHHGWTRVEALNYSPLTCDIRTAAELLGRHVERICEESGHRRVDLVGHSLGGLIARYYVQRLGGDARVRTLVTLGTPHTGTRAVPLLTPLPIIRQMRPESTLLAELAEPSPGCRTRFVSFWSDLDQLMIPAAAARLEHADLSTENIKVNGIGHLALPVHGGVAAEIRRALGETEIQRGAIDAA